MSYDARQVLDCLLDGGRLDEFQPEVAREMICGHARIEGWPVAVIANARGVIKGKPGERPRFGGIIYTESAEKVAFFIETANRERLPILFVQDVSGSWSVPRRSTRASSGRGRTSSKPWPRPRPQARAHGEPCLRGGLLRHGRAGFDPDFILSWPTGRMGVMEASRPSWRCTAPRSRRPRRPAAPPRGGAETGRCDACGLRASARCPLRGRPGFVDAIVTAEETRDTVAFLLQVTAQYAGPHLGPFVLPPLDAAGAI